MFDRSIDCLCPPSPSTLPVHAIRPGGLEAFLAGHAAGGFLRASGFAAAAGDVRVLPGGDGLSGAVLGLGHSTDPHLFGALPYGLPEGDWHLAPGDAALEDFKPGDAVLGFCLGAYRYTALRPAGRPPARLVVDEPAADTAISTAISAARATWLVRDLINTPADRLGPAELAQAMVDVGTPFGAACTIITGAALAEAYPAVAAVGAGSVRPPAIGILRWQGSGAAPDAPLIALCGKGVCFDTGGYDIKPSAGMLRMKKDMGGAAIMLGAARMVMAADVPVRLVLRLGCVENSISGAAMRPSDVIVTRHGLSVEVGNTDAEGRLVLCDLLAEACVEQPALLVDAATLTGAARVALGPDVVAMFSNDDATAALMTQAGLACHDPVWRLPLWPGYDPWLSSQVADLNTVAAKPMAGAIVAALFLQRFVTISTPWLHLDTYAWNDSSRAGRPEGGDAQAMRALFFLILTAF